MSASTSHSMRGLNSTRLVVCLLLVVAIYLFRNSWLPHVSSPQPPGQQVSIQHPESDAEPFRADNGTRSATTFAPKCLDLPGADKVLVLLKTGATELYQKLPTHFVTTFKCIPNVMIFSDLQQKFAQHDIYSAIAPVSSHFRDHHEDFELYHKLQQYQREGQDMSKLKGDGGWNLDKWKFFPMLHSAFESVGDDIEWFVMMEADTSLSWTNLLLWLQTMNPNKPYYLGAQNVIGATTFAHGGSGVVISRATADRVEAKRRKMGKEAYDQLWEWKTSKTCCGDEVIARAFMDVEVPLSPAWPLIQGETVSSIDWTAKHWCSPAITWHHVTPTEVDTLWQFETEWTSEHGVDTPYLYRDVFDHFISRHISVNRTSWNNLSKDRKFVSPSLATEDDEDFDSLQESEQSAVESEGACAEACRQMDECVQWMFSPGRCHLGYDIRFGRSDEQSNEEHWTAGWIQERVDAFREGLEGCKIRWHG